jgi:hypothetical protein
MGVTEVEIPDIPDLVRNITIEEAGLAIAAIFSLAAVIISLRNMIQHVINFNEPVLQRNMIRIMAIVPIYAIDSWLTLILNEHWALIVDLVRDAYEAYVIYCFFKLLVDFLSGETHLRLILHNKPMAHHPLPMCCLTFSPGGKFLHRTKQALVQFMIIRPSTSAAAVILEFFGLYGEGDFSVNKGYLWLLIVDNISFTIALYYLVMFYEVLAKDLKDYKPLAKFLVIKSVIFFSFWQGIAISLGVHFGWIPEESIWSNHLQAFLICIEMLGIAIAFWFSFGYHYFRAKNAQPAFQSVQTVTKRNFFQNLGAVMDVRDVLKDATSIGRMAQTYIHIAEFSDVDLEEKKRNIMKQAWVYKRNKDMFKSWHKRFVFLVSSPPGIVYYKQNPWDSNSPELAININVRGFIDFRKMTGVWKVDAGETKKFSKLEAGQSVLVIEINRADKKKKNRKFYFKMEREEAQEWVDDIKRVTDKMDAVINMTPNDEDMVDLDGDENSQAQLVDDNNDDSDDSDNEYSAIPNPEPQDIESANDVPMERISSESAGSRL